MEAWKFIEYTSLSPVFALSLTTQRWGLEPFPGNLVAINSSLQNTNGSNTSIQPAWSLPYKYSDSVSDLTYYDSIAYYDSTNNITINISETSNTCPTPQPCAESGCLILIEEIGKTRTGPARSNIAHLSYGISSILTIIIVTSFITIASKMGSCFSTSRQPTGSGSDLENPSTQDIFLKSYNPPPQHQQLYAEQAPRIPIDMSGEVARCSELLRAMYTLDLIIWGKGDCVMEEIPQREEMKRRANALLVEVHKIVYTWKTASDGRWTADERAHIEEIGRIVGQSDPRRYNA